MIAVIQCAARKKQAAGHLKVANSTPVLFVANPEAAPPVSGRIYARPDDSSDQGKPWRQVLMDYNEQPKGNAFGLYPAWEMYENPVYDRLARRIGIRNLYILSAGWGLIRADFLTPQYDITFSQSAEAYKRRRKVDGYQDFRMLPDDAADDVFFFGGQDYLPLFCTLTRDVRGKRIVFYNSSRTPEVEGCSLVRFETTARTNWHYQCVNAFLDGAMEGIAPQ